MRGRLRNWFARDGESEDVQAVLIAELAGNFWPAVIMTSMFICVGLFATTTLDDGAMAVLTWLGAFFGCAKLALIFVHRRRTLAVPFKVAAVAAWDRFHALSGVGFAASVGLLGTTIVLKPDRAMQMLATGMLFAYCSGIVARVSVRPRQATAFVLVASLPVIAAAAASREPMHWMLAAMFTVFLAAAIESIQHIHGATALQIGLRLDMTALAQHDPLTGLQNRLGLRQAFREVLSSRRDEAMVAVHCFDLDRFKPVNDQFGHPVGDLVLKLMAERVRGLLQVGSVAARIGGDEFVVVQYPIGQAAEADIFARRLARAIVSPYQVGEHVIRIGVSVGYATSPPGPSGLDDLLELADSALYRVKGSGGGVARGEVAVFGSKARE